MRRIFIATLIACTAITPIHAQKFGKKGGVGSTDTVYINGEPTGGTYSINGATGAAALGPLSVKGPITSTGPISAPNISGTTSGVNTGDQVNIPGNSATATKLQTVRTLSTTGDIALSLNFDGSANISTAATLSTVNATPGTYGSALVIPTLTTNGKGLVTASGSVPLGTVPLGQGGTGATTVAGALAVLGVSATGADPTYNVRTNNLSDLSNLTAARTNLGAAASGANTDITSITGSAAKLTTPRMINGVNFDGTSAITINAVDSTARLAVSNNLSDIGSSSTARSNLGAAASGANTDITSITGSAAKLTTPRTISVTGDTSWSFAFDGSGNVSTTSTLANVNANAGTIGSASAVPVITTDAKGRVTAVSSASLGTLATQNGTFSGSSSGTNTGDQTIALTGDITGSGTGSFAATLSTVNSAPGTCASSAGLSVPLPVVNAKGLVTSCTSYTLGTAAGQSVGTTGAVVGLLNGNNTYSGSTTFSNPITGSISGNAGTATTLATSRTINGVSFNGSANITVSAVDTATPRLASGSNLSDLASLSAARTNLGVSATGTDPNFALLTGATFTGGITAPSSTLSGTGSASKYTAPLMVMTDTAGIVSDSSGGTISQSQLQVIGSDPINGGALFVKYGADNKAGENFYVKTRDTTPNNYTTSVLSGDRVWSNVYQASTSGQTGHVAQEMISIDGPRQSGTTGELPGKWTLMTGSGYSSFANSAYYGVGTAIVANAKQQIFFPGAQYQVQSIAGTTTIGGAGYDYGAVVLIGPGAASPSGAPLKFDYAHSNLLTTPEISAFEVDNTAKPYFTRGDGIRRSFSLITSAGAATDVLSLPNVTSLGPITFTGKVVIPASTASSVGINLTPGIRNVSNTVAGDLWTTTLGSIRYYDGTLTHTVATNQLPTNWLALQAMTPSTSAGAGFNLGASGAAPSTPNAGDVWETSTAIQTQLNGYTQQVVTQDVTPPTVDVGTTNTTAGSGASSSLIISPQGGGRINVTTGTGSAAGALVILTFAHPFPNNSFPVITPANKKTAAMTGVYVVTNGGTSWQISLTNAPTDSTAYAWTFSVTGN